MKATWHCETEKFLGGLVKMRMLTAWLASAFLLIIGAVSVFSNFLSTKPPGQQNLNWF